MVPQQQTQVHSLPPRIWNILCKPQTYVSFELTLTSGGGWDGVGVGLYVYFLTSCAFCSCVCSKHRAMIHLLIFLQTIFPNPPRWLFNRTPNQNLFSVSFLPAEFLFVIVIFLLSFPPWFHHCSTFLILIHLHLPPPAPLSKSPRRQIAVSWGLENLQSCIGPIQRSAEFPCFTKDNLFDNFIQSLGGTILVRWRFM